MKTLEKRIEDLEFEIKFIRRDNVYLNRLLRELIAIAIAHDDLSHLRERYLFLADRHMKLHKNKIQG